MIGGELAIPPTLIQRDAEDASTEPPIVDRRRAREAPQGVLPARPRLASTEPPIVDRRRVAQIDQSSSAPSFFCFTEPPI